MVLGFGNGKKNGDNGSGEKGVDERVQEFLTNGDQEQTQENAVVEADDDLRVEQGIIVSDGYDLSIGVNEVRALAEKGAINVRNVGGRDIVYFTRHADPNIVKSQDLAGLALSTIRGKRETQPGESDFYGARKIAAATILAQTAEFFNRFGNVMDAATNELYSKVVGMRSDIEEAVDKSARGENVNVNVSDFLLNFEERLQGTIANVNAREEGLLPTEIRPDINPGVVRKYQKEDNVEDEEAPTEVRSYEDLRERALGNKGSGEEHIQVGQNRASVLRRAAQFTGKKKEAAANIAQYFVSRIGERVAELGYGQALGYDAQSGEFKALPAPEGAEEPAGNGKMVAQAQGGQIAAYNRVAGQNYFALTFLVNAMRNVKELIEENYASRGRCWDQGMEDGLNVMKTVPVDETPSRIDSLSQLFEASVGMRKVDATYKDDGIEDKLHKEGAGEAFVDNIELKK